MVCELWVQSFRNRKNRLKPVALLVTTDSPPSIPGTFVTLAQLAAGRFVALSSCQSTAAEGQDKVVWPLRKN
jgi:hypothetical protein